VANLSAPQLVTALSVLVSSPEWETWKSFRDRMAHRSNLPRNLYGGTSLPPSKPLDFASTSSTSAYSGELEDFEGLLVWLAAQLSEVMAAVLVCPARASRTYTTLWDNMRELGLAAPPAAAHDGWPENTRWPYLAVLQAAHCVL
jgi:hypothetical protein